MSAAAACPEVVQPVNVLAVLDEYWVRNDIPEDLYRARTALAALLQAEKEYDDALAALKEHYRLVAEWGYVVARTGDAREIASRFVTAEMRREKALCAVKGGEA